MPALSGRRKFLKKMLLALVAFVPAARVLSSPGSRQLASALSGPTGNTPRGPEPLAPPVNAPPVVIDQYVSGKIIGVAKGHLIVDTHKGSVRLNLGPATAIWKGDWSGTVPVEVGDWVKAWGQPSGVLQHDVEKMWVNIVNLRGIVISVAECPAGKRLMLRDRRLGEYSVEVDGRTLVTEETGSVSFLSSSRPLEEGRALQVIALETGPGTVRATRLLF